MQCLADYKVSPSGLGIIVNTPNIVFGQEWDLPEETSGESNVDNESDDEETAEPIVGTSKRRMGARDLAYVYPSRRTISRYLEDASYMNLLMVAEELVNKGDNVVTAGLDDTTKAAGHKFYDVKADHITISGPDVPRKIMTTGYTENISHSGADGAAVYELKWKCLAVFS